MKPNTGITVTYNATGSGSGIQAVERRPLRHRPVQPQPEGRGEGHRPDGDRSGLRRHRHHRQPRKPRAASWIWSTIAKIYTGEITNWKDVGGNDAEIVLIGREAGSGTRDGFESITGTEDACQYRQELTSTGDVITTVSSNPDAIGYASLAAVKDTVKALTVGGVAPSEATVKDGSYVVQRPFVLVTKDGTKLSDSAQKFFDYITSEAASQVISKAGAVPVKVRNVSGGTQVPPLTFP